MRTVLTAFVLLLVPSFMYSQSLGEVAAREKERRAKAAKGKPTQVITEAELGGRGSSGTVSHPLATDVASAPAETAGNDPAKATGTGTEKKEKTEDELRAERAQGWRDRVQTARADVTRLTTLIAEMQTALGGAPAPAYGNRANTVTQLEQARKDLAAAQQQVSALEDEGRRNGYR